MLCATDFSVTAKGQVTFFLCLVLLWSIQKKKKKKLDNYYTALNDIFHSLECDGSTWSESLVFFSDGQLKTQVFWRQITQPACKPLWVGPTAEEARSALRTDV